MIHIKFSFMFNQFESFNVFDSKYVLNIFKVPF